MHFFRHLNFQKWSGASSVLCTLLTWKRASRHNGVHFVDISTSKSGLRMVCFVHFYLQMCFAPQPTTTCNFSSLIWPVGSGAPNHWKKHSESRLSYLFAHLHLLASQSFSSLIFSLLDFSSLTLPTSAFPSLHIVGSLTSKLPSIIDLCIF